MTGPVPTGPRAESECGRLRFGAAAALHRSGLFQGGEGPSGRGSDPSG